MNLTMNDMLICGERQLELCVTQINGKTTEHPKIVVWMEKESDSLNPQMEILRYNTD